MKKLSSRQVESAKCSTAANELSPMKRLIKAVQRSVKGRAISADDILLACVGSMPFVKILQLPPFVRLFIILMMDNGKHFVYQAPKGGKAK